MMMEMKLAVWMTQDLTDETSLRISGLSHHMAFQDVVLILQDLRT